MGCLEFKHETWEDHGMMGDLGEVWTGCGSKYVFMFT